MKLYHLMFILSGSALAINIYRLFLSFKIMKHAKTVKESEKNNAIERLRHQYHITDLDVIIMIFITLSLTTLVWYQLILANQTESFIVPN